MRDDKLDRETTTDAGGARLDIVLDGASSQEQLFSEDLTPTAETVKDPSLPLEERLEAFDDILESEVGDTTLSRARNIEREAKIRQLYLKFEGGNPTGTQKDRIAFVQAGDALRRGYDAVTVATCGNYGVATALAASVVGLKCYIYVPLGYKSQRIEEMESFGAVIIREGGDYERTVLASQKRARDDEIYDANPGGANTLTQLRAYGQIAYEIYDEMRDAPSVVAVPVSNGTTLAGIHKGFLSLYRRGKTSRMPRMVAGSSSRKNPIVHSWLKKSPHCEDLQPEGIRETSVNEPLINWHSIDGEYALRSIRATDGWAENASDKKMMTYSRLIREREGLNILPASTAGLIALLERHVREPLPNDRFVAVLTGKK
ncbi:MAG: pyridoxal-phosphate dependent enzyme [Candidatus Latescibacterota bacterium]|nr:MAG: pyridoxal-phosphate dependent enzyme [Candidatus Latescibacterota bacterium]